MTIAKNETQNSFAQNAFVYLGFAGFVLWIINMGVVGYAGIFNVDMVWRFGILQVLMGVDLLLLGLCCFIVFDLRGFEWDGVPMVIMIFVSIVLAALAVYGSFFQNILYWWVPLVHLGLFLVALYIPKQGWYRNRFDPVRNKRVTVEEEL